MYRQLSVFNLGSMIIWITMAEVSTVTCSVVLFHHWNKFYLGEAPLSQNIKCWQLHLLLLEYWEVIPREVIGAKRLALKDRCLFLEWEVTTEETILGKEQICPLLAHAHMLHFGLPSFPQPSASCHGKTQLEAFFRRCQSLYIGLCSLQNWEEVNFNCL